ncbi:MULTISPECIES: hypothetical protein [Gammaproteobacteria]|uniref:hypothetical protein n=1 Tax=Gammaproteobacteria TaxID=1236 RepID=UPI000C430588|nr:MULTISPECIES: hypothetical protein [Gammaproteobacteria]MBP58937.1 hypothetical protein [Idiomarina sp.]QDP61782.1 MAG: hypothetical protein Tp1111MES1053591_21 [Prokaryotic dsDNA virus sp.]HCC80413.1 hypothetical protein [Methylophaga sp.]|tara:strand:- start:423 stop:662 length:240 start_codon:yes stop_codon:yes gene_type:complete
MKTYCFEEVLAHGEITEWVPADVARDLLENLSELIEANNKLHQAGVSHGISGELNMALCIQENVESKSREAIKKACGEL